MTWIVSPNGNDLLKIWLLLICLVGTRCSEILTAPDITFQTVTLVYPSTGTTLEKASVRFSWEAVSGAKSYQLQLRANPEDIHSELLLDTLLQTTSYRDTLSLSGLYRWQVRAENEGYATVYTQADFRLQLPGIENSTVHLLSPSQGAEIMTTDPIQFAWRRTAFANQYRFQLTAPDFETAPQLLKDSLLSNNNLLLQLVEGGDYQWRVFAMDATASSSPTVGRFTYTHPYQNHLLIRHFPTEKDTIQTTEVFFRWENHPAFENYRLQIARPGFDNLDEFVLDTLISEHQLQYSLLAYDQYQWRVRAEEGTFSTPFSMGNFSLVDPFVGVLPLLLSPKNGVTLEKTTVVLLWEPISGVDSYRVQLVTPHFRSPTVYLKDVLVTESSLEVVLDDFTSYEWRVKGVGSHSQTSYAMGSFRIQTEPDMASDAVTLFAPANNSQLAGGTLNFHWGAVAGATRYHIQIARPSFSNPLQLLMDQEVQGTQADASVTVTSTYEWRVKALNTHSSTDFTTFKFTIR